MGFNGEFSALKIVDKSSAKLGEILSYTICLDNNSSYDICNIIVYDNIGSGLLLINDTLKVNNKPFHIFPQQGIKIKQLKKGKKCFISFSVRINNIFPEPKMVGGFATVISSNYNSFNTNSSFTKILDEKEENLEVLKKSNVENNYKKSDLSESFNNKKLINTVNKNKFRMGAAIKKDLLCLKKTMFTTIIVERHIALNNNLLEIEDVETKIKITKKYILKTFKGISVGGQTLTGRAIKIYGYIEVLCQYSCDDGELHFTANKECFSGIVIISSKDKDIDRYEIITNLSYCDLDIVNERKLILYANLEVEAIEK